MDNAISRYPGSLLVYANAFVVGGVLMGFEMLGSRYLFPYFGSGMATWAALISTVLIALTIGYFIGGIIIGRCPSSRIIILFTAIAAAYLFVIPFIADMAISSILKWAGEGAAGVLLASVALLLIPLSLLGTLSPIAVRLLINSADDSGRIAGLLYAVSTLGNVFGTLFTTFVLIPSIGSRAITYLFAGTLGVCSLSFCIPAIKVGRLGAESAAD